MAEDKSFIDSLFEYGGDAFNYITNTDDGLLDDVGSLFQKSDGSIDFGKIAGGIGALGKILSDTGVIDSSSYLGQLFGGGPQIERLGYQGSIPDYTATRTRVPMTYDPDRRPGSGGQRYFTDIAYSGGDRGTQDTSGQAATLQAMNLANPAMTNRQGQGLAALRAAEAEKALAEQQAAEQVAEQVAQTVANEALPLPVIPTAESQLTDEEKINFGLMAPPEDDEDSDPDPRPEEKQESDSPLYRGGIIGLNRGMYLSGATDGMADKIPAMIGNTQPAALSDGEFVIPADVVSGLGNGNSDAGAKNLYAMMDRVRRARTGTTKQAPAINPNKMMPQMRG